MSSHQNWKHLRKKKKRGVPRETLKITPTREAKVMGIRSIDEAEKLSPRIEILVETHCETYVTHDGTGSMQDIILYPLYPSRIWCCGIKHVVFCIVMEINAKLCLVKGENRIPNTAS